MNNLNPVMIDPRKAMVVIPSHDGRIEAGCTGGLVSSAAAGLMCNIAFVCMNSEISAVRNSIAHMFVMSKLDWLVTVDSDIQFNTDDARFLLSVEKDFEVSGQKISPTRNEDGAEIAVSCEYSKKTNEPQIIRFGMGFCRFHRSVFEKLAALKKEDGSELLSRYYDEGMMKVEYYPVGTTSDGRRLGEDVYFWNLCALAGITPRIERRTRLIHWGRAAYPYKPQVEFAQ